MGPDVGCRGKRLYSDKDPVPFLRCFVDSSDGAVVRHATIPGQLLNSSGGTVRAMPLTVCDADEPKDKQCEAGCGPWGLHYLSRIYNGIALHQADHYVAAIDVAFGAK